MSKSLARVRRALEATGLMPGIREMPSETRTAAQAAEAVGCALDQIAKSVIFRGRDTDSVFLFVTAGGNRVDQNLAEAAAGEVLDPADATFVRVRTGFAIGGVAPLGCLTPPVAFFDPRLLDFPVIWAAAGTPRHVFSADPGRLAAMIDAEITTFSGR